VTKPAAPKLTLLAIAWPIFIEQTLRLLIETVDTFMVSHASDGATHRSRDQMSANTLPLIPES
jgi:Na+-driven multidrug efflux pump